MNISRKDWLGIIVIGIAVGFLVQPIISNVVSNPAHRTLLIRFAFVVFFAIMAPIALCIAAYLGKFLPVLYQFAKFSAVGVLNSSIDLGVLNTEIFLSGMANGAAYAVFKAISFLVSTTNSFLWNKYWTFHAGERASSKETLSFYAVAFVGFCVNVGTAVSIVHFFGSDSDESVSKIWANIGAVAGILAALFFDFFGYKYLVFKRKPIQATESEIPSA